MARPDCGGCLRRAFGADRSSSSKAKASVNSRVWLPKGAGLESGRTRGLDGFAWTRLCQEFANRRRSARTVGPTMILTNPSQRRPNPGSKIVLRQTRASPRTENRAYPNGLTSFPIWSRIPKQRSHRAETRLPPAEGAGDTPMQRRFSISSPTFHSPSVRRMLACLFAGYEPKFGGKRNEHAVDLVHSHARSGFRAFGVRRRSGEQRGSAVRARGRRADACRPRTKRRGGCDGAPLLRSLATQCF